MDDRGMAHCYSGDKDPIDCYVYMRDNFKGSPEPPRALRAMEDSCVPPMPGMKPFDKRRIGDRRPAATASEAESWNDDENNDYQEEEDEEENENESECGDGEQREPKESQHRLLLTKSNQPQESQITSHNDSINRYFLSSSSSLVQGPSNQTMTQSSVINLTIRTFQIMVLTTLMMPRMPRTQGNRVG